jgi:GTP diphosphokinase / guanosine-3',5'-bis(diphosphate) 3'-diphosphatase
VRDILETPNNNAVDFIDNFQSTLFSEEIFVYTNKGDMRTLPKGATALDFAFEIHSNLGATCQSVKVNGKLVPLSHILSQGDKVIVIPNSNQKPNEQWLKWIITSKAKSKIKQSLRDEKRKFGDLGKEQLERKLSRMKIAFEETNIEVILKYFKYSNHLDLYIDIVKDLFDLSRLKELRVEGNRLLLPEKHINEREALLAKQPTKKVEDSSKLMLLVAGQNAAQYTYEISSCCNPVKGDPVFAYMSIAGMKIHRLECINAEKLFASNSHRILRAEWVDENDYQFIAKLRIKGLDEVGVVKKLSDVLTQKLNVNIKSLNIKASKKNTYIGDFDIFVNDLEELNLIIATLQAIDNVTSVRRVSDNVEDEEEEEVEE